jgi:hypothetical protein
MALVYRRVDRVLSGDGGGGDGDADSGCEVCEGDCLLLETAGTPGAGDLALVRDGGVESLCRWDGERSGELLGIVVGIRRRL